MTSNADMDGRFKEHTEIPKFAFQAWEVLYLYQYESKPRSNSISSYIRLRKYNAVRLKSSRTETVTRLTCVSVNLRFATLMGIKSTARVELHEVAEYGIEPRAEFLSSYIDLRKFAKN